MRNNFGIVVVCVRHSEPVEVCGQVVAHPSAGFGDKHNFKLL